MLCALAQNASGAHEITVTVREPSGIRITAISDARIWRDRQGQGIAQVRECSFGIAFSARPHVFCDLSRFASATCHCNHASSEKVILEMEIWHHSRGRPLVDAISGHFRIARLL